MRTGALSVAPIYNFLMISCNCALRVAPNYNFVAQKRAFVAPFYKFSVISCICAHSVAPNYKFVAQKCAFVAQIYNFVAPKDSTSPFFQPCRKYEVWPSQNASFSKKSGGQQALNGKGFCLYQTAGAAEMADFDGVGLCQGRPRKGHSGFQNRQGRGHCPTKDGRKAAERPPILGKNGACFPNPLPLRGLRGVPKARFPGVDEAKSNSGRQHRPLPRRRRTICKSLNNMIFA